MLLDLDEYLPAVTLAWCRETLASLGFPYDLDGRQTNDAGERLHSLAYLQLRDRARTHLQLQYEPQLTECEKPYLVRQWVFNEETQRAFANSGEQIPQSNDPLEEQEGLE